MKKHVGSASNATRLIWSGRSVSFGSRFECYGFFFALPFGVGFFIIAFIFSNPLGALLTHFGFSGLKPPSDGKTVDILFDEGILIGRNFGFAKFIKRVSSVDVDHRYFGRSAGTLVALSAALDIDVEELLEFRVVHKLIKLHRNRSPFRLCGTANFFRPVLEKMLPLNAHIK